MKFYVASKWNDRELVQQVMRRLIKMKHSITVDWTDHVNPENDTTLQEWAERDIEGVRACDTYIGLFINKHIYTGAIAEMGGALVANKRVWLVGNFIDSCIFVHHPLVTKFPDLETMFKVLEAKPKK